MASSQLATASSTCTSTLDTRAPAGCGSAVVPPRVATGAAITAGTLQETVGGVTSTAKVLAATTLVRPQPSTARAIRRTWVAPLAMLMSADQASVPTAVCQPPPLAETSTRTTPEPAPSLAVPVKVCAPAATAKPGMASMDTIGASPSTRWATVATVSPVSEALPAARVMVLVTASRPVKLAAVWAATITCAVAPAAMVGTLRVQAAPPTEPLVRVAPVTVW